MRKIQFKAWLSYNDRYHPRLTMKSNLFIKQVAKAKKVSLYQFEMKLDDNQFNELETVGNIEKAISNLFGFKIKELEII